MSWLVAYGDQPRKTLHLDGIAGLCIIHRTSEFFIQTHREPPSSQAVNCPRTGTTRAMASYVNQYKCHLIYFKIAGLTRKLNQISILFLQSIICPLQLVLRFVSVVQFSSETRYFRIHICFCGMLWHNKINFKRHLRFIHNRVKYHLQSNNKNDYLQFIYDK